MDWFDIPDPWQDEIAQRYRRAMETVQLIARGIESDHFPEDRRR